MSAGAEFSDSIDLATNPCWFGLRSLWHYLEFDEMGTWILLSYHTHSKKEPFVNYLLPISHSATTRARPDGIVIRSFADPAPARVISLMRRRSRKPSPRATALVQCLQQIG